jgi:hypothetical protein
MLALSLTWIKVIFAEIYKKIKPINYILYFISFFINGVFYIKLHIIALDIVILWIS